MKDSKRKDFNTKNPLLAVEESENELAIDHDRKEKTLKILHGAVEEKEIIVPKQRAQILYQQIAYMDKRFVLLHLAGNLFILLLLLGAKKITAADEENIYTVSMISSILMGILSITAPAKLFSSKLAELSESCFFNVRQIVGMDMVISGGINLITFLILIPFGSFQWQVSFLRFGMYLLVPCVFTETCCLGLLMTEAGRTKPVVTLFAGVLFIIAAASVSCFPGLYEAWALSYWIFAFIIGTALLCVHIHNLWKAIEKGDILCTR